MWGGLERAGDRPRCGPSLERLAGFRACTSSDVEDVDSSSDVEDVDTSSDVGVEDQEDAEDVGDAADEEGDAGSAMLS